jgi:cytochrome bd-type quinol oxidase subunit 2
MNMLNLLNKINSIGKYLIITVLLLNLFSLVSAQTTVGTNLSTTLKTLCTLSQTLLGIAVMLMVILAGATYALGQMLGAETRARASVWGTAMLTGAVVGIVIYVVTPWIIGMILGKTTTAGPCDFTVT